MGIHFVNEDADFTLSNPEKMKDFIFRLPNESGVMGDVSPDLCGDLKTGQNSFYWNRSVSGIFITINHQRTSGA